MKNKPATDTITITLKLTQWDDEDYTKRFDVKREVNSIITDIHRDIVNKIEGTKYGSFTVSKVNYPQ